MYSNPSRLGGRPRETEGDLSRRSARGEAPEGRRGQAQGNQDRHPVRESSIPGRSRPTRWLRPDQHGGEQDMAKASGIEPGTTNSVVSVVEGGNPTGIANQEGSRLTPSAAGVTEGGGD